MQPPECARAPSGIRAAGGAGIKSGCSRYFRKHPRTALAVGGIGGAGLRAPGEQALARGARGIRRGAVESLFQPLHLQREPLRLEIRGAVETEHELELEQARAARVGAALDARE